MKKQIIGIVDYGLSGNILNIKKAVEAADDNIEIIIAKDEKGLQKADKLILPGVGAYGDAMQKIKPIQETLVEEAKKKYTLGICLGMQLLSTRGFEFGEHKGLDLIDGEVRKIEVHGRVPHLGWASIEIVKQSAILKNISENDNFYFMHSYEFINYKNVVALSNYMGHKFVSVVEKENIFGVQFHPEKSREVGLKVFKNFIGL